jgi:RimJ/RimL family protein N-acetyltransferase
MRSPHWPLFDLRVVTPRLELRYPDDDLVAAIAERSAEEIHDPSSMPFSTPWTRTPKADLPRSSMQHLWKQRAELSPGDWSLPLCVTVDGEPSGIQVIGAKHFAITRSVSTGSWLVRRAQGQGLGKEMRAAVLHLAFAGLDAQEAHTEAFADNPRSIGVTTSLGYEPAGSYADAREGAHVRHLRFLLTRDRWQAIRRDDIELSGVGACLAVLGAAS